MAAPPEHAYEMQLYYEDTDFTGAVYHGNYLRYFERARDDLIGIDILKAGLGAEAGGATLHVHKVEDLTFRGAARHAEVLVLKTRVTKLSDFRLSFSQSAYVKPGSAATGPEEAGAPAAVANVAVANVAVANVAVANVAVVDAKPIVQGTTVVVFLDNATQALVKVPTPVLESVSRFLAE